MSDAFDTWQTYRAPPDPNEKELRDLRFWKETALDDLGICRREHTAFVVLREQSAKDQVLIPALFVLLFTSIMVNWLLLSRCKDLRAKLGIR